MSDSPATPDDSSATNQPADDPLRSVHTTSFPELLAQIGASVLVTTYQAGKLVVLRNDGGVLNTHFRNLLKPMGLAVEGGRLAIGCSVDVWEFHNVPAVCAKLDESDDYPTGGAKHDTCYLPRRSHCTGDVQIHEMAWVQDHTGSSEQRASELIFVNTAFSCLAIRSQENSFEPVWRPRFIQHLSPGDACHLNGLAIREGQVRYVTALGETTQPDGWREKKCDGGILIDVESGETIVRGLSMPHSPRWYNGRLWLLESGQGTLGTIDPATGKYEPVAQFPGFTRGLSFYGPLAFVGLSQVRESAVFSGIPLVDRLQQAEERTCGVWVVNIETGQTIAFCRFEEGVQEIFAVEVLPGVRFPDLVNHDAELIGRSYVLGDAALADVPAELRQ
ncbi:TIGR03032 family protein [Aeoliella sp. ICT_H6.2]|uniref:TIGR03032 family protein n=1 Tax=Aeoliella straminimaris TaxID=2954799 RepID=A0A9X2FF19_9BACT|nr:TIGR03032 family protein [Aeoliella straminimaris]MCO6047900.1 TIGR03032 family protein [Aeoliella straminimaris]